MIRKMLRSVAITLIALGFLFTLNQTALAGPPLLCHPYEIGTAKSLPWDGSNWRATKSDYNLNRLVDDTLALLRPEEPVIVRMETLRRATIYATKNQQIAAQLHARLAARVRNAKPGTAAHALFDLGYLKEAYKQSAHISKMGVDTGDLDGYSLVVKAISLQGRDSEMEFAAALMTLHPRNGSHNEHLRKAIAGASEGTLLARNLVSHFSDRGKNFAELKTNLQAAKN